MNGVLIRGNQSLGQIFFIVNNGKSSAHHDESFRNIRTSILVMGAALITIHAYLPDYIGESFSK